MIVKEVTAILDALAPPEYAEDFDNVGLLIGNPEARVSGILVTLDTLENVVDEAIVKKCNLIVSFHPILFKGIKKITGATYVERVIIKAIEHQIAIVAVHTALDNAYLGVNAKICEVLGLQDAKILIPQEGTIHKITTYVPVAEATALKESLFSAGAGHIGNYSNCSFATTGQGSFRAGENTQPLKGQIGETHYEEEIQLHMIYPKDKEQQILKALFKNHPYEEVAYEIQVLKNKNQQIGMGMIGNFEKAMEENQFLAFVKEKMDAGIIRHSPLLGKKVQRVAVLGGSGAFAIENALLAGADAYLTSDISYHQFFKAEQKMIIADIGHYESEQFTKTLLVDYLKKKIPNFAISLSESITNPIKYY